MSSSTHKLLVPNLVNLLASLDKEFATQGGSSHRSTPITYMFTFSGQKKESLHNRAHAIIGSCLRRLKNQMRWAHSLSSQTCQRPPKTKTKTIPKLSPPRFLTALGFWGAPYALSSGPGGEAPGEAPKPRRRRRLRLMQLEVAGRVGAAPLTPGPGLARSERWLDLDGRLEDGT